jgi:N-acetylmuramoyl-L-alanine amidase
MILLSAGHHPLAKGASYNDHYEHDEAILWVSEVANLIRGQMMVDIVPAARIEDKTKWINAQGNVHLVCEIHFNSDESKRQHGSETLYCPGSRNGRIVAEIVQRALGGIFPPSRGAKEGWHRMDRPGHVDYPGDVDGDEKIDYLLKATACPAIIVEPEFIYNWSVLQDRRHPACGALAQALIEAVNKIKGG